MNLADITQILIFSIIFNVIFIIGLIISLNQNIGYIIERKENEILISELEYRISCFGDLDTSELIRKLIIQVVTDIAVMNFHTFKDTHDLSKITRSNVRDLVAKVAKESHEILDIQKLEEYDSVFRHDFYDKYIVYTASAIVKNILEKEVINIIKEEG